MDKVKILLVEDDEFIRDIYYEILSTTGYNVTNAINGQEAYDQIKKGTWDLVLLDVMMPVMTGIEVLKRLKEEKAKTNYKKLIFLTNIDDGEEINEIISLSDGYFLKSDLTPPILIEKVKALFPEKE